MMEKYCDDQLMSLVLDVTPEHQLWLGSIKAKNDHDSLDLHGIQASFCCCHVGKDDIATDTGRHEGEALQLRDGERGNLPHVHEAVDELLPLC